MNIRRHTGDDVLSFGKFKGHKLKDVPYHYKQWMYNNCTELEMGLWLYLITMISQFPDDNFTEPDLDSLHSDWGDRD